MSKNAWLVAVGAAIGSSLRYGIAQALPATHSTDFPKATLLVNIVGASLIGLAAGLPQIMTHDARRYFLVTGVLGGFTTFSALAVQTLNLNSASQSIAYLGATFVICVVATHFGHRVVTK
jgi:CrcB protein